MAVTVSSVVASPLPNGNVLVAGLGTFDASYAASGEVIDLSAYLGGTPVIVYSGDDGYVAQSNRGTAAAGLCVLYEAGADAAALDEVTAATNTAAVIVTFMAVGTAATA